MIAGYFDTSALVKLILAEAESDALRQFMETRRVHAVTCDLTPVEIVRAVRRGAPRRMPEATALIGELEIITVTDGIRDWAGLIDPPALRTLDAIHVAAALPLRDELAALITYDQRMREAAEANGLRVEAPA